MQSIVVDAGPLIAACLTSDRHHATALAFLGRHEGEVLATNLIVLGEVAAVIGSRHPGFDSSLRWILANVQIDAAIEDVPRALEIVAKYKDLPADFADASLVAMAERRQTDRVASTDTDFDVYRLPRNRRFQNVFWSLN